MDRKEKRVSASGTARSGVERWERKYQTNPWRAGYVYEVVGIKLSKSGGKRTHGGIVAGRLKARMRNEPKLVRVSGHGD